MNVMILSFLLSTTIAGLCVLYLNLPLRIGQKKIITEYFLIVVIFISIWITLSNISPPIKCFMDCGGAYSTYILYSNTWMGGIHGEYAEEHPDDDDDIQNFILSIKITHLVSFPSCNSLTSGVPLVVDIGL